MTRDAFDAFCAALPAAAHVVQWGGASVWKVGGKIFAVCSIWGPGRSRQNQLQMQRFVVPGAVASKRTSRRRPYLGRRQWVQLGTPDALPDGDIRRYIEQAHAIVAAKLTKAKRKELGL